MKQSYTSETSMPRQVAPNLFIHVPGVARFEGLKIEESLYNVAMVLDLTADGIKPIDVRVESPDGSPPISSTTLRSLKVGALTQQALLMAVQEGRTVSVNDYSVTVDIFGLATNLPDAEMKRIREQGPTAESLRRVAQFYNLAVVLGLPPAKQVEVNLGLPRTTASKWIRRAREKQLLSESVTGDRTEVLPADSRPIEPLGERELLAKFGFADDVDGGSSGEHSEKA